MTGDAVEREIRIYVTAEGRAPFEEWLQALRDERAKARILSRIDRVRCGNFGDFRRLGGGVSELRIDQGPGYRVYFGQFGSVVVLLLCGGDKRTQSRDIDMARRLWKEAETYGDEEL